MAQYHSTDRGAFTSCDKQRQSHYKKQQAKSKPLVSIIIPTHNAENYIARCLESCINQTLQEIEIIIVDDCGADNSISIAQNYASNDSRIKIIKNPHNLGTFHARAKGIESAKAGFCMFADPDDFLEAHACKLAFHTINTHNVDIAHFGIAYSPKSLLRVRPNVHNGRLDNDSMRFFLSAGNNTQGLWDKIIRTDILHTALKELDFIKSPLLMLEDGLLVLVASLFATSYYGKKHSCIYHYCHNPSSITKDKSLENFYKKQSQLDSLLSIVESLMRSHPQHTKLFKAYQHKVASTLLIENRNYTHQALYESLQILHRHKLHKNIDMPAFLKSTLLSLRYAFRWQNLVRLLGFLFSFGKMRL